MGDGGEKNGMNIVPPPQLIWLHVLMRPNMGCESENKKWSMLREFSKLFIAIM